MQAHDVRRVDALRGVRGHRSNDLLRVGTGHHEQRQRCDGRSQDRDNGTAIEKHG
jgi:hypothetical protein